MTTDSDRVEEIKKHCECVDIWEDEIIEYADVEWLIQRVDELEGKLAAVCYDHHRDTTGE